MIPQTSIIEWRNIAPWKTVGMVEQDLIISRLIVDIYNDSLLSKKVAFRGGTALHKLYLQPAKRYSEDIDNVQTKINDPIFRNDIADLINPDFEYGIDKSFEYLYTHLFSQMNQKIGFGTE